MNDDVPPVIALLIGSLIGGLLYGPVRRWVVTLTTTLRERAHHPGSRKAGSTKLLLIFATMHPAPWLLIIGLPYGVYRLWSDPLRVTWACLLAGAALGALLMLGYEVFIRSRMRRPDQ
jgi:hypothetical protein